MSHAEQLSGKVVLVTGGASGLGASICRATAERGARVIVADVNVEAAETLAGEIGGHPLGIDLIDATRSAEAVREVVDQHGKIDILVNNAGTDKTVSVEELDPGDFERVIAVNLSAPFVLAKAVFPHMRTAGGGYIVNIVSTAAKRAWANASAYHASKWGLLGLSHALHVEARPHNIKVTAVVAGGMRTPFILDRFPDTPLENLQDPSAVAETICFLFGQPRDTVIPELMIVPMRETSWP